MDTDGITLLGLRLSQAPAMAAELADQLRRLSRSARYAAWAGSLREASPFQAADGEGYDVPALAAAGLVDQGSLRMKVNLLGDRVLLTDGVWVDPAVRVFPFCDESQALVRHTTSAGLHDWADWVVDLATGCGHNVIGLPPRGRSVALDINPRALAYLVVNRALNAIEPGALMAALNDIRDGLPPALARGMTGRTLFLANMPFGPAPGRTALPLTSNGGRSGADLQQATLEAVQQFAAQAGPSSAVKAMLMTLTVGDAASGRWQMVERARSLFGAARVKWSLLDEERLLRVDGTRELGNPAALRVFLSRLAACRLYTPEAGRRADLQGMFSGLAREHEDEGSPDIAFGMIELDLTPEALA